MSVNGAPLLYCVVLFRTLLVSVILVSDIIGSLVSVWCFEDVAVPGRCHGLRCVFVLPKTDAGSWIGCQHKPGFHSLLVRTGGSLCPVQTESEQSSSWARACQSLISLYTLHTLITKLSFTAVRPRQINIVCKSIRMDVYWSFNSVTYLVYF